MRYFTVEPEITGGLGENTIIDRSVHPPIVRHLHYEFDGWLGDSIVESFPCFIVTEEAKKLTLIENLKGFKFDNVLVTTSKQFRDIYKEKKLPWIH